MTILNPDSGSDTWVWSLHPRRPNSDGDRIRLVDGVREGGLHIPLTNLRGLTPSSAVLIGRVRPGFAPQTVTVHLPIDKWKTQQVTWNTRPAVAVSCPTTLSGSFADGDAVELDVLDIIAAVASGGRTYRGLWLTTDADTVGESDWYAFDSGEPAWELVIDVADPMEQPTELHPSGDFTGLTRPTLDFRPTDLGASASSMGALQVQADPDADEVSPAFDSGWLTTTTPVLDLTTTSFAALTAGQVLRWRVRTRDVSGTNVSDWSDWTDATEYRAMPTLTVDSPTGGVIGDVTPTMQAHMTGETMTTWRARVMTPAFEELWDSGVRDGAFDSDVPFRNPDTHRRILKGDDLPYLFDFRAWGTRARAEAIGARSYVRSLVTVIYDDDEGVTAPDSLTVAPVVAGDARLVFTWHRTEAADAWLIVRDGEIVERLDPDEVDVSAGVYTWTDHGLAEPYVEHVWKVRAVESGARSAPSNAVTYTSHVRGFWIVPVDVDIDPIVLKGVASLDAFGRADRVATYQPPATGYDVNIYYSQEGISGSFDGTISDEAGKTRHALADARRVNALAAHPGATVRLVWANVSIPAELTNLAALPHSSFNDDNRRQRVTFTFKQNGD